MLKEQAKNVCFFSQPLADETLFSCLSNKTLSSLKKIRQKTRLQKGQKIFSCGEVPRRIYIIINGQAKLYSNFENVERDIRLIHEHEIIGLNESLGNFKYETTAETLTVCECDYIRRDELLDFLNSQPEVCFHLLGLMGKNLQKNYHFFQSLTL